ncbi:MAG TPA: hemolysin family protein [Ktedonobacteraceae bacterium]|jgi:putative hemolysin
MGFEITIIFILFLANGFFAAAEIAIVSARRSRLQQQADAGKKSAELALDLASHPDRFLATVQVGMTLINTLAAAFGGASLNAPLTHMIEQVPFLAPYADTIALALVVILITYFSLVIGELVPKRLGLQSAETFATFVAPFMNWLARIISPAIALLSFSTNIFMTLLQQNKPQKSDVTEEDIVYLAREGAVSGTVETGEEEFINRVFRFTDRNVSSVMMPRTEMVAIELGTPLSQVIETFLTSGYTRLPLYETTLDNVIGVLYAKDLLRHRQHEETLDLRSIARPPLFVSEYQRVADLLTTFRAKGIHLAVVIDEYSQVVGLVTLEDVLEELVGEIQDEYDKPEDHDFVQREDGSWLVNAMVSREAVEEKLGLTSPDERADYKTLAGMILAHLGRIPTTGDIVTIGDFQLEVIDMDGRRIDKVLITRKNPTPQTGTSIVHLSSSEKS